MKREGAGKYKREGISGKYKREGISGGGKWAGSGWGWIMKGRGKDGRREEGRCWG